MVGKKSIFEKLGLVEPVEENENPVIAETEEEIVVEEQVIPSFTPEVEETKPLTEALQEVEQQAELGREEASMQIEDKLEELIGAYEKNKLLTIEDIYRTNRMETDAKRTIFMADVLKNTLPDNLPIDMKRESVLNIMNVSQINMDQLLNDAYKRIDALNKVMEDTAQTTEDVVQKNEASIRELESRIRELREMVTTRQKFTEDQNSLIEYEIQRVIGIVDFIKPKK